MNQIENIATQILKDAYGDNAEFRDGQLEAIVSVVSKNKTLVVQKTGWGNLSFTSLQQRYSEKEEQGRRLLSVLF